MREKRYDLTRKALESGIQILDGGSIHIADIGHQVGDLFTVSFCCLSLLYIEN